MRRIILIFLMMCAVAGSAMTRDQVCLEQNGWFQAHASAAGYSRGFNVWTPYGDDSSEEWLCWMFHERPSAQPEGWSMANVFKATVKAGYYLHLPLATTAQWYPDTAAPANDVTFSGGDWSGFGGANYNGFYGLYPSSDPRIMSVVVPANITRLYALGYIREDSNKYLNVGGSATVVNAQLDFTATGDFASIEKAIYPPREEIANYPARTHLTSVSLIAQNCGGETITFQSPSGSGGLLIGLIAINDNASAGPDEGVYDPLTVEFLTPVSYDNSGTEQAYYQVADGPIRFKIGSADPAGNVPVFWGNGHWGAAFGEPAGNWLDDSVATVVFSDENGTNAYATHSGGVIAVYDATNATPDLWERHVCESVSIHTTGAIDIQTSTAGPVVDIGTYTHNMTTSTSGMYITQEFAFNAAAAAGDIFVNVEETENGGAIASWSLSNDFTQYMYIPHHGSKQTIANWTAGFETAYPSSVISMFSPNLNATAYMTSGGEYFTATSSEYSYRPLIAVQRRDTGDGFAKLLSYLFEDNDGVTSDFDVANGDIITTRQFRQFLPTGSLEQTGSGGSSGAGSTLTGTGKSILTGN